jgi:hypothetical protein
MALTQVSRGLLSTSIVDNGNDTAITIDSSENVLVGTDQTPATLITTSTTSHEGVGIADGYLAIARNLTGSEGSGGVAFLNRLATDGPILDLRKDGTAVGNIGVASGNNLTIDGVVASHAGLEFGTGRITPRVAGATADNAVDLGYSTQRFQDLYLSGGAYLGGTAAANKLDDYEEGTWTPTAVTGSVTASSANYTKIGRTVVLSCVLSNFTNNTSTASVTISGLPFTSKTASLAVGSMLIRGNNRTGVLTINPFIASGSSVMTFYLSYENSTSYAPIQHDHFSGTTSDIIADITYTTS